MKEKPENENQKPLPLCEGYEKPKTEPEEEIIEEFFTCKEFEIRYYCEKGRLHTIEQPVLPGMEFEVTIRNKHD